MPKRVQLPDGSIGEFPDTMQDSAIEAVLQKQFPHQAQEQPGAASRFVGSFGSAIGAPERVSDFIEGPIQGITHPVSSGKLLLDAASKSQQDLIDKAYQYQHSPGVGNKLKGLAYGLYSAIPFAGPTLAHAGEQFGTGDIAGGAGTMTGVAAPIVAGEVGPGIRAKLTAPKKVGEFLQGKASDIYQQSLKPSMARNAPNPATIVKTGLENKIPISQAGADKISTLVDEYNNFITDEVKNSPLKVNKYKVASRLNDTYDKFSTQVNPEADIQAIADSGNEFLRNQPAEILAKDAQALKVGTYRQVRGKYGKLADSSIESQKDLARGLREELVQGIPELQGANAGEGKLLQLQPAIEQAVKRAGNRGYFSLGSAMATAAVKGVTGSGKLGIAAGVMKAVLDDPIVSSKLAIAIYDAGKGRISLPAARARVQGYAASLAAASASNSGTPGDQTTE